MITTADYMHAVPERNERNGMDIMQKYSFKDYFFRFTLSCIPFCIFYWNL